MKVKKADSIVTAFFILLILVLTVASMLNPVRKSSESENRELAQMPKLSTENVLNGSFERGYESFVTDQFVWRDGWINVKSQIERTFGRTTANGVYFARDGYFIERMPYMNVETEQLEKNIGYVEKFASAMSEVARENVVITLAPTAAMIHSDKLPLFADEYDWDGKCDEISRRLGDSFLDLRPAMRQNREDYIYYKTDHHWTTDGAYYAYRAIIERFGFTPLEKENFERVTVSDEFYGTIIAKLNIGTEPDTIVKYEPLIKNDVKLIYNLGASESDSFYNDEKLKTRDKYAYFLGGNDAFVEIDTSIKNGRVLALAKDSYANCMIPFLACHFEKIYVVDLRYFNTGFVGYTKNLGDVTDALVLYNISGFSSDRYLVKLYK